MQWLNLYLLSVVPLLEVALLWKYPWLLLAMLLVVCVIALWARKRREDLTLFLVAAFWGLALEVVGVSFGVGSYAQAQLWGVPFWTPLLWGLAALFVKELSERFHPVPKKR